MEILGIYVSDWLLLITGLLVAVYWFLTMNFGILKKLGIPHEKPLPFFGNSLTIFANIVCFEQMFEKQFGKLFGWYESRNPVICTTDPEILRHVLIKEFNNFTDRRVRFFRGKLAHGTFDERGSHWRGMRNLLTPAFSSGKLRNMMQPMQDSVDHLVEQMESIVANKEGLIDSKESASMFTMDVIGAAVFGITIDCRNDPQNTFAVMGRRFFEIDIKSAAIILQVFFNFLCPLIGKFFYLNMFDQEAEDYFSRMVREAIKAKKETAVPSKVFLGIIINAEEQGNQGTADAEDVNYTETTPASKLSKLTEEEVIGNALLFFAAGFETTATTLGFLLYFLACNQEAQDKLRAEVSDVVGDEKTTPEILSKLHYVEQCIFETLRLCPPVLRVDREASQDIHIGDLFIPKGMIVNVPIYALHRNPEVWPDPETWNPDRFSPEEKAARDSMCFMPFGLGPRQCIGMRLALLEIKMAVANIIRKFRFSTTSETPIPLTLKQDSALCKSEKPLKLRVECVAS